MVIRELKGVGPQLEKKLNSLNIYTIDDLLNYYPYRYNNINIINIKYTKYDEICILSFVHVILYVFPIIFFY